MSSFSHLFLLNEKYLKYMYLVYITIFVLFTFCYLLRNSYNFNAIVFECFFLLMVYYFVPHYDCILNSLIFFFYYRDTLLNVKLWLVYRKLRIRTKMYIRINIYRIQKRTSCIMDTWKRLFLVLPFQYMYVLNYNVNINEKYFIL